MSAYVIKSWQASETPDANGNYVHITGRTGGLISWIFNLIGISPTVELKVNSDKISFIEGSWSGLVEYHTPVENVCATLYGFTKPWKEAVILGFVLAAATYFLLGIPGILIGIIYYFLNKTLTVGFSDMGGRVSHINFKRSIIEGHNVDEHSAAEVCRIIQARIQRLPASSTSKQTPPPPPTPARAMVPPPPPKADSARYYYANAKGETKGPFGLGELMALEKSGEIKPETNIIVEGGSEWSTWNTIKTKEGK